MIMPVEERVEMRENSSLQYNRMPMILNCELTANALRVFLVVINSSLVSLLGDKM